MWRYRIVYYDPTDNTKVWLKSRDEYANILLAYSAGVFHLNLGLVEEDENPHWVFESLEVYRENA